MQDASYYSQYLGFHTSDVEALTTYIDRLAKPQGALGQLEDVALTLGLIFKKNATSPKIELHPHVLVFAADHGINIKHQTSSVPSELTTALINNGLNHGAGITSIAQAFNIGVTFINAGVLVPKFTGPVVDRSIRQATSDFSSKEAMTLTEVDQALAQGAKAVHEDCPPNTNVLILGEIGIGNTASASAIMSKITGLSAELSTGRGSGIDDARLELKKKLIKKALARHEENLTAKEILAAFGGFEIAQMCGAMIEAAHLGWAVLIDGFMVTAAAMLACKLDASVRAHLLFAHESNEGAHRLMLEYLKGTPLLRLGLRLGEGTGAALAYPLLKAAVGVLNDMAHFDEHGNLVKN